MLPGRATALRTFRRRRCPGDVAARRVNGHLTPSLRLHAPEDRIAERDLIGDAPLLHHGVFHRGPASGQYSPAL